VAPDLQPAGGAGRDHDGARLDLGVQRLAFVPASATACRCRPAWASSTASTTNRISASPRRKRRAAASTPYQPGGGLQDVHVGARWNWVLSPSWMLTSNLQAKRLLGDASKSPLTERSTNLTVSTAIAYRF
jgi:outer membrane protein